MLERNTKGLLPTISVIIPVRLGGSAEAVLRSLADVDYPQDRFEVLVVEGTQPSRQRNQGVAQAAGQILYFLDDDSVVASDLFRKVIPHFADPRVTVVGGPAVTRESDSFLQHCFGYALGSCLGSLSMRCKFKSIGQVREATEKDLILANLAMRRAIYQKENGLNETLYPNEENELLNRLTARGSLFIYDPQAMVYRSQRESLARFAHQMFSYGRGRMEHFMSAPSFFQPLFLLPLIFCLYLMSVPLVPGLWFRIPLAVYLVAGVVSSLVIAFQEKQPLALLLLPVLFPIMHVSYGIGLAWGVIKTRLKFRFQQEPPVAVKVKRVKSMAWVSQLG